MPERIYYNGLVQTFSETGFDPLNRSFRFGDGLFETIRVREGRPLFVEAHLLRLRHGMEVLGLELSGDFFKNFPSVIQELWQSVGSPRGARLRLSVWRMGRGAYAPERNQADWLLECIPLHSDPYEALPALSLVVLQEPCLRLQPWSGCKTANALPYVLAARKAKSLGFDDGILKCGSLISECTASNLFMVQDGALLTPHPDAACLPGIMRGQILKFAKNLNIPTLETTILPKMLKQATEIFCTNAIQGIRPIAAIRDEESGEGLFQSSFTNHRKAPTSYGPVTYKLQNYLLEATKSTSF